MKNLILFFAFLFSSTHAFSWGFYGHQKINYMAVFLLPPSLLSFYKPHIEFLSEHATDPDKRRYAVDAEAPRHYIDLDHYGFYPFSELPRKWEEAVNKFTEDSLQQHGIVPWWTQIMYHRLVKAFMEKDHVSILRHSADLGHYIADAHVPLHTSSNYNGQKSGQRGIHGLWESRIPELLAEKEWDFFIGKAQYISDPLNFIWQRILESAGAVDSVLMIEKKLSARFSPDQKFAWENRNGILVRQFSSAFTIAYDASLRGMIERRMHQSIYAVASYWYSAWVDAGQPDLSTLSKFEWTEAERKEFEVLNNAWRMGKMKGREE